MLRAIAFVALVGILACFIFSLKEDIDKRNEIQYLRIQQAHITACTEHGGHWEDNHCMW